MKRPYDIDLGPNYTRYNTNCEFVGYQKLKDKQKETLEFLEQCASKNEWNRIHYSHFNWWMFPYNQASSHRYAYTVYTGDVAELKKDPDYIKNYLRGVELLALSWGWDLYKAEYVSNPHEDQKWANWPIRLYKATFSLQLFGFKEEYESMRKYALDLIKKGVSMTYNTDSFFGGRDLAPSYRQSFDEFLERLEWQKKQDEEWKRTMDQDLK